jgi:16S rRNA (cytidine1402-2'-O)-methyltransferase
LQEALLLGKTLVTFESPFRVENALEMIAEVAPNAEVVVAKELTKIHEEFIRGGLAHVRDQMKKMPQKGEYVIVVAPPPEPVPQET